MITELENLAGQIRQLSREDRKQLFSLIPELRDDDRRSMQKSAIEFKSQNISVDAYVALADDDKAKFLDRAEEDNALWVGQKIKELKAAWMMVVDGEVAAFGESMNSYPDDEEFLQLLQRVGKYPFVFFNPLVFAIEESGSSWPQTTVSMKDYYPAIALELIGAGGALAIDADFDTGASEIYVDLARLISSQVLAINPNTPRRSGRHLSSSYQFIAKRFEIALRDENNVEHRVEKSVACVFDWKSSPFVQINPARTALIGRAPLLELKPKVELDFGQHATTVRY